MEEAIERRNHPRSEFDSPLIEKSERETIRRKRGVQCFSGRHGLFAVIEVFIGFFFGLEFPVDGTV